MLHLRCIRLLVVYSIVLIEVSAAWADDWPQYRGPNRDGVSRETDLLKSWPNEGPKLLWTYRDGGAGFAPPSIVGNHLYCMGSKDTDDCVYALDARTGEMIWSKPVGARRPTDWGDGPCATPTVDGDRLYTLSVLGELHCVDRQTGKNRWRVHLKNEMQGKIIHDGRFTESCLIDGDRLICSPGGSLGTMAALDKMTGRLLWRSKGLTEAAVSSSCIAVEIDGLRQYVNLNGRGVAGVAADDGRLLWRNGAPAAHIMVNTPIHDKGRIYVTAAYGVGCGLIKLARDGDGIKADLVYRNKVMKNHHSGVVLVDGHIFGCSEPNGWVCQKFETGEQVWEERDVFDKGSFAYADGHLYCYGEREGTVALVEVSTKGWIEKSRFTIPEQTKIRRNNGKIWTPPVIGNGRLFLRDNDLIFCYDIAETARQDRDPSGRQAQR